MNTTEEAAKQGRETTPSFIVELPLRASSEDGRSLGIRLRAWNDLYNATLGELLKRLDLMHERKQWKRLRDLPRTIRVPDKKGGTKTIKNPAVAESYAAMRDEFRLSKTEAENFATKCKKACWIHDHLTAEVVQVVATRAWRAVEQYMFGKKGRPEFSPLREAESMEGKSNKYGIRWRPTTDPTTGRVTVGKVEWKGLSLKAIIDTKDDWLVAGLQARTKYVRLVKKEIRGEALWFAQLVQEGLPPRKRPVVEGVVAFDAGPSMIAVVSEATTTTEAAAEILPLCPGVVQPWKEIKRLQRAMDRSRRATNPDNYNPDGTIKKLMPGRRRTWVRSNAYMALAAEVRECERALSEERRRSHGETKNKVLSCGNYVKAEKISYKAWQKMFGRSSKVRGIGMLVSMIRDGAERDGGHLHEFGTRQTRLSQYDHTTDDYRKKPLSLRVHALRDGSGEIQRDLYSAFLALHVGDDGILDAPKAAKAFAGARPLLEAAASRATTTQDATGRPETKKAERPSEESALSHGGTPERAGSSVGAPRRLKTCEPTVENRDAVRHGSPSPCAESPEGIAAATTTWARTGQKPMPEFSGNPNPLNSFMGMV